MSDKPTLQISYGEVTEKNLGQLKALNSAIFPVKYNDKFYSDLLSHVEHSKLVQAAYHNDILIGAVCCRIENKPGSPTKLYIMTLGVLAAYRGLGIGAKLIDFVLQLCKDKPAIEEIYLHVQTSNEDGINFYKKYGFTVVEEIKNYYKRIDPPHCYVLAKKLKN